MALDPEKARKNAERLLKLGRIESALEEYKRLAEEYPRDLPIQNLCGDLLVRAGRSSEAGEYFERIAAEYVKAGFFLKAIAILKKILRYDPTRPEVLARVGDLYLKQKLPGEARGFLLQAADRYVQSRTYRHAREIYQKLAQAEPADPLHRIRLAEVQAAEGDAHGAGESLLSVGAALVESGRHADAEKVYRRAGDLVPGNPAVLEGLGVCLVRQSRVNEAIALLERGLKGHEASAGITRALIDAYLEAGRDDDALGLIAGPHASAVTDETIEQLLRRAESAGRAQATWERLDAVLATWRREDRLDRLVGLLERLAGIERTGHLPALSRLAEIQEQRGDATAAKRALELLLHGYRAHGMGVEAERLAERLSAMAASGAAESKPAEAPPAPTRGTAEGPVEAPVEDGSPEGVPRSAEAPAVPLGPQDEEFVSMHLTQAEIFEKYGLLDQSLEQLREVTRRFPGLASAQHLLAEHLRSAGDVAGRRDALVGAALAHRAAGERDRAREAAREAARCMPLAEETVAVLAALSLIDAETAPPAPSARPAPPAAPVPAVSSASAPVPAVSSASAPVTESPPTRTTPSPPSPAGPKAPERASGEIEVVIDLEGEREAEIPAAAPAPPRPLRPPTPEAEAPPRPASAPPAEDLEEIAFYLDQGMVRDALRGLAALRERGFGGAEIDALEARSRGAVAPTEETVVETVEDEAVTLDEEALSSISQALDAEAAAPASASAPSEFTEQSVEDVFALFKQHVEAEIGGDDYRTHYDLGIAYKEMGLLDDAVGEFRIALGAPEVFRDACSMIALCFREKGELREAAQWYRQALDAPSPDEESLRGLRYDLAEVLVECGDAGTALELFRLVLTSDPSYRDIQRKVAELESSARS